MIVNITGSNNISLSCYPYNTYFLHVPRDIHFDHFLLTIISINAVFAFVASCSNALVIYTISRTPSLQNPSNILIAGLAISDLSVGVFSQPSYCLFRFFEFSRNFNLYCLLGNFYVYSAIPLAAISFFTVTAITTDRFLAVHLHLRYQDFVTTKRAGIALAFIWMTGMFFIVYSWAFWNKSVLILNICLLSTLFCLNVYFILRVCLVIHRHSLQIQSQQSAQQPINMARFTKSAKIMFYVIGAFSLCYIPHCAFRVENLVRLGHSYTLRSGFILSETLVMMNGVLNPIIYCWRIEGFRSSAVPLVRQLCRDRQ